MDSRNFLESCPIGKAAEFACEARPLSEFLHNKGGGAGEVRQSTSRLEWVFPAPRVVVFCDECGREPHINPAPSYPLTVPCLNLGSGPYTVSSGGGKDFEIDRHKGQFLRFVCGDCDKAQKKYSIAVEIFNPLSDGRPKVRDIDSAGRPKATAWGKVDIHAG